MSKKIDVVIVGSGISGIAAAAHLAEKGIKSIILEGRNRIGGRLFTDRTSGSAPYELGCSWFHESGSNPLVDLAKKEKISFVRDDQAGFYTANGPLSLNPEIVGVLDAFKTYAVKTSGSDQDKSLKAQVAEFMKSQSHLNQSTQDMVAEILRIPELANGTPWSQISAKSLSQDTPDDYMVLGGYDRILDAIKRHTLNNSILLGDKVVQIDSGSIANRVVVKTQHGEHFESKYVIVSIPVSNLKHEDVKFVPNLPQNLQSAIESTDISLVGKVYFEFEEPFWPVDQHKFIMLATPGGDSGLATSYPIVISNWYILNGENKHPGLAVLTPTPLTEQIERDASRAFDILRPVLEEIRTDKSKPIPNPTKATSSKWSVDEFSRGSYSMYKVGNSREAAISAFEIGADRIRFAGEHTILKGAGFAHGAYNSGIREAEFILDRIE